MTPSTPPLDDSTDDDTTLVVPVIDPVYAFYVVTCELPPTDPWAAVHEHLAGVTPADLIDDVRRAIGPGSGIAAVRRATAPPIPWEVIACSGSDPTTISRGRHAAWQLLVRCPGSPGGGMAHHWAALAVARSLQATTGGVLVDVVASRILDPVAGSAPAADALGPARRSVTSTWVGVWHSIEDDGTCWLTTDGLGRFGLPELSIHGVAEDDLLAGHHLLMGLAHRLIRQQAKALGNRPRPPAFRTVPRQWTVTGPDCAAAFEDGALRQPLPGSQRVSLADTANDLGAGVPMMEVSLLRSPARAGNFER